MERKSIILIVAHEGFQPTEYQGTRQALGNAGYDMKIASNKSGPATSSDCQYNCLVKNQEINVDLLIKDVVPENHAAIVLIGGPGALDNLDNEITYFLLKRAVANGVPVGAICISPRILAHAGILQGKNATGWDEDKELAQVFNKHGVNYVHQDVVVDGNIVTATGPKVAQQFGEAIAKVLSK